MGKQTDQRDRTLLLARILQEETDEKHPLPMTALVARLARHGVIAERKSIYRDASALRKHGMDVTFRAGSEGGWYINRRTFDPAELRVLMDALSVYRWATDAQKETILTKLTTLTSQHQRKSLRRPVAAARRSAAHPDDVQQVLDRIHGALQARKALSFIPFTYDKGKCRTALGARRVISPKGLLWTGDNYRLLAWDHREQTLRLFRPDRMSDVLIAGMPVQGPETDASLWDAAPFGLDPTRKERLRLRCCQELAGEVLDRFGADAALIPDGPYFTLTADAVVGPEFWGWMASHGDRASVVAPPWAAKLWQERYQPRPLAAQRPQAV